VQEKIDLFLDICYIEMTKILPEKSLAAYCKRRCLCRLFSLPLNDFVVDEKKRKNKGKSI
jgi:hypothetical protein